MKTSILMIEEIQQTKLSNENYAMNQLHHSMMLDYFGFIVTVDHNYDILLMIHADLYYF